MEASQIGGVGGGGGPDFWEKLPKNPVFSFWQAPLVTSAISFDKKNYSLVEISWILGEKGKLRVTIMFTKENFHFKLFIKLFG